MIGALLFGVLVSRSRTAAAANTLGASEPSATPPRCSAFIDIRGGDNNDTNTLLASIEALVDKRKIRLSDGSTAAFAPTVARVTFQLHDTKAMSVLIVTTPSGRVAAQKSLDGTGSPQATLELLAQAAADALDAVADSECSSVEPQKVVPAQLPLTAVATAPQPAQQPRTQANSATLELGAEVGLRAHAGIDTSRPYLGITATYDPAWATVPMLFGLRAGGTFPYGSRLSSDSRISFSWLAARVDALVRVAQPSSHLRIVAGLTAGPDLILVDSGGLRSAGLRTRRDSSETTFTVGAIGALDTDISAAFRLRSALQLELDVDPVQYAVQNATGDKTLVMPSSLRPGISFTLFWRPAQAPAAQKATKSAARNSHEEILQ
jgi:hypothetical protein